MQYYIENKSYQYYVGRFESLADAPHIHTHLEMIYLLSGRAEAASDGKWHPMEQGDLYLACPNQIHHYKQLTDVAFYLIIFDDAMDSALREFLKEKRPICPVVSADYLPADIADQLAIISQKRKSLSAIDRLAAKGNMLSFLSRVLSLFAYERDTAANHDSVRDILSYCTEHYTEVVTLDTMAQQLHLSKYYICHVFQQRMNIRFTEFLNNLRTNHACHMLKEGSAITDAAFSSGFASIRTFNRVFRDITGLSPREYAQQEHIKRES